MIPIVFMIGSDPVKLGLVASLNRPGGNITGVSYFNEDIAPKRLELLHEFAPSAKSIALLVNPAGPAQAQTEQLQAAARPLGLRLQIVNASNAIDLEEAFGILIRDQVEALQLGVDPLFSNHVDQIVALAQRNKIPTIYPWREYVTAGGLMSYGPSLIDASRLIGIYSGKILRGANPAELPVEQNTKVEFVINLKTAKAQGLVFSLPLLGRADEVIE